MWLFHGFKYAHTQLAVQNYATLPYQVIVELSVKVIIELQ
jgi:hypothetical protein